MAKESLRQQASHVRKTLPEHFARKDLHTDTAGVPWHGRDYTVSAFPDDRGERVDHVERALAEVDSGADATREKLVAALAGSRVLIPIQAIATDVATTESGLHADNASDMAMVKIQLPSGDLALPIFTSADALSAWNPKARPVPLVIEQAAQSAVAEGCASLIVDAGRRQPILLSRSALWALGQGRRWIHPARDPEVLGFVESIPAHVSGVVRASIEVGESREVDLRLALVPGMDRESLETTLSEVQRLISRSELFAERVSSLRLALERA